MLWFASSLTFGQVNNFSGQLNWYLNWIDLILVDRESLVIAFRIAALANKLWAIYLLGPPLSRYSYRYPALSNQLQRGICATQTELQIIHVTSWLRNSSRRRYRSSNDKSKDESKNSK